MYIGYKFAGTYHLVLFLFFVIAHFKNKIINKSHSLVWKDFNILIFCHTNFFLNKTESVNSKTLTWNKYYFFKKHIFKMFNWIYILEVVLDIFNPYLYSKSYKHFLSITNVQTYMMFFLFSSFFDKSTLSDCSSERAECTVFVCCLICVN